MKRLSRTWIVGCLLLAAVALVQAGGVVTVTQGRAEIRKAGQAAWALAGSKTKIGNNDMLRTGANSRAQVSYDDGSEILLAPNSQILFNDAGSVGNRQMAARYATAFFGAIFFVVREAMPKARLHRIYTPTAVLTIRGTRFGVTVDPNTGSTLVEVTSGTVMAKNILLPLEYYVESGQSTQILLNQAPLAPSPVSTRRMDEIRVWVGDKRMRPVKEKARAQGPEAGQPPDILVLPLGDFSGFHGPWNLSTDLTALVAGALATATGRNVAVAREKGLELDEIARLHNARRVVTGDIDVFDVSRQVRMGADADRLSESCRARIGLTLLVLDPDKQSLITRLDFVEEAETVDCAGDWKKVTKGSLNPKDPALSTSALAAALDRACNRVTELAPDLK